MLTDDFVKDFLATGPEDPGPAPEMEAKPMYTRAEVDEMIANAIQTTIDKLTGNAADEPEEPAESEENNGNNEENGAGAGAEE